MGEDKQAMQYGDILTYIIKGCQAPRISKNKNKLHNSGYFLVTMFTCPIPQTGSVSGVEW